MTKLGALWKKQSKKGNNYMSGVVEIDGKKTDIIIFENIKKEEEKQPDYNIYLREQFPNKQE